VSAHDFPLARNRVLALLLVVGLVAAFFLDFLTNAPNRLVSGAPVPLGSAIHGVGWLALLPGIVLLPAPFLRQQRPAHAFVIVAASLFLAALVWLAGSEAASLSAAGPARARISLGAGFWVLFAAAALALADALRRLSPSPLIRIAVAAGAVLPVLAVIATGRTDQLAILREYAAERDVFAAAVLRHIELVFGALVPTLAIGLPLGLLAVRRVSLRAPLFSTLNVIQTIPSIAMFGLLMAPLGAVAHLAPGLERLGISGIGMAPAILALMLYALLPIARNTQAGFASVPAAVLETARGMGMTRRQILWSVEVPLALPVVLAGVRITLVQLIGLAVLAALVGAGGLGAIMFQGLFADALDQVLLGVIPVVLLAMVADAALNVLIALTRQRDA
jgi:osmoprotectant transport system permease protein